MSARAPSVVFLGLFALVGCKTKPFWSIEKSSDDTLRTVRQGQLIGGKGRYGSHAWLGISFARPPTGERRWKKPEPPDAWTGVREAMRFGHVCPQPGGIFGGGRQGEIVGDEDCLTLSVWAPSFPPSGVPTGSARLPVMLWIHGGGNTVGTAAFYEGGRLAAEQKVIVVAVQYRLGLAERPSEQQQRIARANPDQRGRAKDPSRHRHVGERRCSHDRGRRQLEVDPRLPVCRWAAGPKGRCRVLRELTTTWGHFVARAEYDTNPVCRDFAFDAYPWK